MTGRLCRAWPWLVALALAVVVLGPALAPGYVLRGDMVFVPRQPMKAAWWGLDGSVPRAVPMDGLVALLSSLVPGQVLQKVALLGALVLAATGAERMVRPAPWYARLGAMVVLVWNPWVQERLLIGQWAIVLGYAVLPWVVVGVDALRSHDRAGLSVVRRWVPVAWPLALAAVASPSSGAVALGVAVVLLVLRRPRPGWRVAARVTLLGGVLNLPWVVAALRVPGGVGVGEGGFSGFAARAESAAGLVPSLLSFGGIWKTSVVPEARTLGVVVVAGAVLTLVAVAALALAGRDPAGRAGYRRGLAVVAVGAFLLAWLPALGPVSGALDAIARHVPGLALLRDSHRFLAPAVLLWAAGTAVLLTRLGAATRGSGVRAGTAGAALVLVLTAPLLLAPQMAWGVGGTLRAVDYPAGWTTVAELLERERAGSGDPDALVVLPWMGSYRGFAWNDRRAVLDPAPRFLPGTVLVDDRVYLEDRVLPSEDSRLAAVGRALATRDPDRAAERLRALGVGWVLVHADHRVAVLPSGSPRWRGDGLLLLRLAPAA
ncbi:MAG: hypothetical protein Q8Q02_01240 [Nocardioides sp.]|nr:hypothetical protein [Nocardioides sp.]